MQVPHIRVHFVRKHERLAKSADTIGGSVTLEIAPPRRTRCLVGRPPARDTAPAPEPAGTALAPEIGLPVDTGTTVSGVTLDGRRLAVQLDGPDGSEIAVINLRTGRIESRVKLQPK